MILTEDIVEVTSEVRCDQCNSVITELRKDGTFNKGVLIRAKFHIYDTMLDRTVTNEFCCGTCLKNNLADKNLAPHRVNVEEVELVVPVYDKDNGFKFAPYLYGMSIKNN